jgi:PadR family transcriptional regulator PadR
MSERHEINKSNIDSLLLSLISEQPLYGYQMIKDLEGRSQGYFKFKEGTLYPALHKLEESGMAEGKWQTLATGQKRKYYHITDKGLKALKLKRDSWIEFLNAMNLVITSSSPLQ